MKNSLLAISVAILTIEGSARAALMMNGSLADTDFPGGGSFTSSSVTLTTPTLITTSETGMFASLVPPHSDLTSYTGTLTGLSATPATEDINNFFQFSTPDSTFGTSGTTPNNRFDFDLATLSETTYISSPQTATFSGIGMLIDTTGQYASSPADFTLSFSGQDSYSFTLAVVSVPEPGRYGIYSGVVACLAILFGLLRHRPNSQNLC
jgi:hypothetical protein